MTASLTPTPPFVSEALAASDAGTWEYDVLDDRLCGDAAMQRLLGLAEHDVAHGVSIGLFVDAVHPDDRSMVQAKREQVMASGGVIAVRFRALAPDGTPKWMLARGRYERDAGGRVVRGCGIVVDLTETALDGAAARVAPHDDGARESALDRAAEHALATRQAIDDLDAVGLSLRPAIDALLLELGHRLSAQIGSAGGLAP